MSANETKFNSAVELFIDALMQIHFSDLREFMSHPCESGFAPLINRLNEQMESRLAQMETTVTDLLDSTSSFAEIKQLLHHQISSLYNSFLQAHETLFGKQLHENQEELPLPMDFNQLEQLLASCHL